MEEGAVRAAMAGLEYELANFLEMVFGFGCSAEALGVVLKRIQRLVKGLEPAPSGDRSQIQS
jgi:hypothetical protein